MRIVRSLDEFIPNLESCQREAKNAFVRDRVLHNAVMEGYRAVLAHDQAERQVVVPGPISSSGTWW